MATKPNKWEGCKRTGRGYERAGNAYNAAEREEEKRTGQPASWDAMYGYEVRMFGGRYYWRKRSV